MIEQGKKKIPKGWEWVKLGEICELSSIKHIPIKEEILFYIGLEHIEKNSGKLLGHAGKEKIDTVKNKFEKGDLLYGKLRPYLNKVYLASQSGVCSTDILVFKISSVCYGPYLYYLMLSSAFVNEMSNNTSGVNLPRVSTKFILNYPIALPSISAQQSIVCKIEELFSEIDKGIENLRIAQQQLKIYRHAVLKWAFEGKLTNENVKEGELPKGWTMVQIKDVAEIFGGYAFKSGEFKNKGKYQVLRMGNVRPGIIRYDESPVFIDIVDGDILSRSSLQVNDIIITQTGTRKKRDYGFTAIIKKPNLLLNQRIAALRVRDNYLSEFLLYFSWTNYFKDQFFAYETGNVGQGNVGMNAVTETLVPFCSIRKQQKIVQAIETRLSGSDKMDESITQSLQQAEALRQSILKKAFEGELV